MALKGKERTDRQKIGFGFWFLSISWKITLERRTGEIVFTTFNSTDDSQAHEWRDVLFQKCHQ